MNILIIKLSSMGDIVHTLPAISEIARNCPDAAIDWVVEKSFSDIPRWHPNVRHVIPAELRKWRKTWWKKETRAAWKAFKKELQSRKYDLVIDAQGLMKTAILGCFFVSRRGELHGYNKFTVREPYASFFYDEKYSISTFWHAISRIRVLCSYALNYKLNKEDPLDYKIEKSVLHLLENSPEKNEKPYLFFLHGTTWNSKLWPETSWRKLIERALENGFNVKMTSGNEEEKARADRLAEGLEGVEVFTQLSIPEVAKLLYRAEAAVTVDTGFGHLAAAINVPTVSIFGATDHRLATPIGNVHYPFQSSFPCSPCKKRTCRFVKKSSMTPPCYDDITADDVWKVVNAMISGIVPI